MPLSGRKLFSWLRIDDAQSDQPKKHQNREQDIDDLTHVPILYPSDVRRGAPA